MKKKVFTCPLTGIDFTALETADDNIICTNPITHEEVRLNYNSSCNLYYISPEYFKHVELVTFTEAAAILNISLQRVSKIAADGIISTYVIGSNKYMRKADVLEYKRTRKVGAPTKEDRHGL